MTSYDGFYAAYKAKDIRFDGRFFIGITSTGIYCRPICRARQPKESNCNFYSTAAQAERAGFRPCMLCRPELAPGSSPADAIDDLLRRAIVLLEEHCGSGLSISALAAHLGCTDRHLRRVFTRAYNVTPVQHMQTCRLLLAKNLLTDTDLSVLDVAMSAGFGSLRRFNDLFKKSYHLSPTALRKCAPHEREPGCAITLAMGFRPPYRFDAILSFLKGRAIPGIERVEDGAYLRTVRLNDHRNEHVCGWIRVSMHPSKNALNVTVSDPLLRVLPQVLAHIRHLFDLSCDPAAVYDTLSSMNAVREGLCVPGTRLPGCFDPFEMAVRAVLGQQITVKAASTLAGRLAAALGTPIKTGVEGLTHVFPTPAELCALDKPIEDVLGPLGIITARSKTILAMANALESGAVELGLCASPEEQIARLTALPGIGDWTAQYIAMRTMGYTDAFLETDAGIKKALSPRTPKEMIGLAEGWRPWRAYATINLWNSLS